MPYCPGCDIEYEEGEQFCWQCGSPLVASPGPPLCPKCNVENPAGAKFCKECGASLVRDKPSHLPPPPPTPARAATPLRTQPPPPAVQPSQREDLTCPVCGEPAHPGSKFCEECGAALRPVAAPMPALQSCPACGVTVEPGARFCEECGTALVGQPGPPPPPPPGTLAYSPPPPPAEQAMRPATKRVLTPLAGMPELLRKRWPWVLGGAAVVVAILVVAVATGVIGGVPGGMRQYKSQDLGFSFNYPSDWTVSDEAEGVVNLMSPKEDAALMAGVRPSLAGTPEEAAEAIWQEYQASVGDLALGPQQKTSVNGRPAVLQSAQYTSRGETATILAAVILDGGQEYFIWLLSQDGSVKNPQGMMDKVLAGFDTQ